MAQLFEIIDRGEPQLSVVAFNGGLFDPRRHPFLTRYAVGDAHLRRAMDKLARVENYTAMVHLACAFIAFKQAALV